MNKPLIATLLSFTPLLLGMMGVYGTFFGNETMSGVNPYVDFFLVSCGIACLLAGAVFGIFAERKLRKLRV